VYVSAYTRKPSQDKLAKILGTSQSTVSRILSGEKRITAHELVKICKTTGADPFYLLFGRERKEGDITGEIYNRKLTEFM